MIKRVLDKKNLIYTFQSGFTMNITKDTKYHVQLSRKKLQVTKVKNKKEIKDIRNKHGRD